MAELDREHMLKFTLCAAVPFHILRLQDQGGPDDDDWQRAHEFGDVLAAKGDVLLFGSKQKGETARLFNETARAIAVLAFCPGGITLFGEHWEAK